MFDFDVKKVETTTSKSLRMPNDLLEQLEKLAYEKNTSLSKVIIKCCEYAIENLKK